MSTSVCLFFLFCYGFFVGFFYLVFLLFFMLEEHFFSFLL